MICVAKKSMNIPQGLVYEFRIHLGYSVVRYDEIVNLKLKKRKNTRE